MIIWIFGKTRLFLIKIIIIMMSLVEGGGGFKYFYD